MHQTITAHRATFVVTALVDAVRRQVDQRRSLDAIGREMEQIVTVDGAVAPGRAMHGPRNKQIARMLQGTIVERQRLLIREANYLRMLVGLPPVRSEDGVIELTAPPTPRLPTVPAPDPPPVPEPIVLNRNRRAILRAVVVAMERGEEPTYTVIRAISGIPERSATRALKWALENGVLVNRDGAYAPGEAWAAREDRAIAGR